MSRVVRRIGIIAVFVLVIGAFAGCGKKLFKENIWEKLR